MKILNNNNNNILFSTKFSISKNLFINKNKKLNNKFNQSDFINTFIKKNQEMQDTINNVKLNNYKTLMNLEDQRNTISTNIKDFCEKNKDSFSQFMGINANTDQILSGNTDLILQNMSYSDVTKGIGNLQTAVAFDDLSELKKYYSTNLDSYMTFAQYRESNGETSTFDRNTLTGKKGDLYSLLDILKNAYKDLFNANDAIKNYMKSSDQQIEEMKKNMEKMNSYLLKDITLINDTFKSNNHKNNNSV